MRLVLWVVIVIVIVIGMVCCSGCTHKLYVVPCPVYVPLPDVQQEQSKPDEDRFYKDGIPCLRGDGINCHISIHEVLSGK